MYGRYRTRKHGNTHWTCHHVFLSLEAILWLHLEFSLVWGFHFAGGFSFLGQRATCGSPSFGDLFLFPLMAWTHWLTFASFATMVAHILPSFTINYHQLPSLTIYHSPSVDLLQLFCLAMESERRDGCQFRFFNPVPRIVPPSWTKSERLQRGVSQGIFPEMVLYYPLVI